jgi:glycosyltransferase involved in cell wall biosynthesis
VLLYRTIHASFLEERINSILKQTYKNYEIILLDDKSTDNSIEIIKRYENNYHISHIKINKTNNGSPFIQWEKGFNLAEGELIWIAESDDSCDADFLKK